MDRVASYVYNHVGAVDAFLQKCSFNFPFTEVDLSHVRWLVLSFADGIRKHEFKNEAPVPCECSHHLFADYINETMYALRAGTAQA